MSTQVCKTAFLRIHGVSNGRVNRALQASLKEGGTPHQDQWGRHVPANKTTEEDLAAVRQRIEMIPKYRSHYSRADNPNREYLNPELSIAKMYSLYCEQCTSSGKRAVSNWVFRRVFNEEYNLTFGRFVTFNFLCLCPLTYSNLSCKGCLNPSQA